MKHQDELREEMQRRKIEDEQRAESRLKEDRAWRASQEKENDKRRFRQQVILQFITAIGVIAVTLILSYVFGLKSDGTPIINMWG